MGLKTLYTLLVSYVSLLTALLTGSFVMLNVFAGLVALDNAKTYMHEAR